MNRYGQSETSDGWVHLAAWLAMLPDLFGRFEGLPWVMPRGLWRAVAREVREMEAMARRLLRIMVADMVVAPPRPRGNGPNLAKSPPKPPKRTGFAIVKPASALPSGLFAPEAGPRALLGGTVRGDSLAARLAALNALITNPAATARRFARWLCAALARGVALVVAPQKLPPRRQVWCLQRELRGRLDTLAARAPPPIWPEKPVCPAP